MFDFDSLELAEETCTEGAWRKVLEPPAPEGRDTSNPSPGLEGNQLHSGPVSAATATSPTPPDSSLRKSSEDRDQLAARCADLLDATLFERQRWARLAQVGVPSEVRARILEEAISLESHMVRGKTYGDESKRQDRMLWLNSYALSSRPGMRWLTNFLHNLAVLFGRRTEEAGASKLTLTGREMAMLACYDPGGFFTAHRDGSAQDSDSFENRRILTVVYYIHHGRRTKSDGGALRVFPEHSKPIDLLPDGDSLVLLRADTLQHEVRVTCRERWAITMWFHGSTGHHARPEHRLQLRHD